MRDSLASYLSAFIRRRRHRLTKGRGERVERIYADFRIYDRGEGKPVDIAPNFSGTISRSMRAPRIYKRFRFRFITPGAQYIEQVRVRCTITFAFRVPRSGRYYYGSLPRRYIRRDSDTARVSPFRGRTTRRPFHAPCTFNNRGVFPIRIERAKSLASRLTTIVLRVSLRSMIAIVYRKIVVTLLLLLREYIHPVHSRE